MTQGLQKHKYYDNGGRFHLVCVDEEEDEENELSQEDDQENDEKLWIKVTRKEKFNHLKMSYNDAWWVVGYRNIRTLSSRHLFSLMAPRQPRKPVTMMTVPRVMMRLAAESDGNEGDRVAKRPCDTDSHTPTPNRPHPPS